MSYMFFDGDGIGDTLEIFLIENRIREAKDFSEILTQTMNELRDILERNTDVEIIICGGDDLLIKTLACIDCEGIVNSIRSKFSSRTGHTMSCGIGDDVPTSVRNLYTAKLYGKNRVLGAK